MAVTGPPPPVRSAGTLPEQRHRSTNEDNGNEQIEQYREYCYVMKTIVAVYCHLIAFVFIRVCDVTRKREATSTNISIFM
mmetsp:Transcript_20850/g.23413  ORF Transcript_20850/g.23413 Transcript_20850/m.23413 type:complete len:80 (+) Transcript_20850:274-513(+)